MKRILVVDDEVYNREILEDILQDQYEVVMACNGEETIELLDKNDHFDLMLLDLEMPVINGFGVLDYMKETNLFAHIPVIIITGDSEAEVKCFEYMVSDFITKPFKEKPILKRVENVIIIKEYQRFLKDKINSQHFELQHRYNQLKDQTRSLQEKNKKLINIIGDLVEGRNLETGTHVKRVCGFTKILGLQYMKDYPEAELTKEKVEIISNSAALHDVGKIAISDIILLKPARLTSEEFDTMKTHTLKGCDIINKIDEDWDWSGYQKDVSYNICRSHHERYDGNGYPDKLAGDAIPISAQLVSIADVYDALVSERPYKKAFSKDEAFNMIMKGECGVFSPKLLNCFKAVKGQFEEYMDTVGQ